MHINIVDVLCVDDNGQLKNPGFMLQIAVMFNNIDFAKYLINRSVPALVQTLFSEIVAESNWPDDHSLVEVAELMLPYLVSAFGESSWHYSQLVQASMKCDRPDLLRVFLSHETVYKNVAGWNWYDILESKDCFQKYLSVGCVRVVLGEGLCINPRDDDVFTPPVLHDAIDVNCTGLVKLYLRAGADTTQLASRTVSYSRSTSTPAQYARKKEREECAELIEQFFPTLAQLCLWTVRLNLRKPMSKYVDSLCVPVELKHEIVLP